MAIILVTVAFAVESSEFGLASASSATSPISSGAGKSHPSFPFIVPLSHHLFHPERTPQARWVRRCMFGPSPWCRYGEADSPQIRTTPDGEVFRRGRYIADDTDEDQPKYSRALSRISVIVPSFFVPSIKKSQSWASKV